MGQSAIGTPHLLLGLLAQDADPVARAMRRQGLDARDLRARIDGGDGLDGQALATVGIDLEAVRRAAETSFGPGALGAGLRPRPTGHLRISPPAKQALELSLRAAQELHHDHIAPGHLLLGVLNVPDGQAARLAADAGADLDALRAETVRLLTEPAAA